MQRLSYTTVARAIAEVETPKQRQSAEQLVLAYEAVQPPLESARERALILRTALRAWLDVHPDHKD